MFDALNKSQFTELDFVFDSYCRNLSFDEILAFLDEGVILVGVGDSSSFSGVSVILRLLPRRKRGVGYSELTWPAFDSSSSSSSSILPISSFRE